MRAARLIIIAGPNGSGKSTLTDDGQLAAHGIDLPTQYINADRIARQLAQVGWQGTRDELEREAQRQARRLRVAYREGGGDFAFETVFSHPSTLIDMQLCRTAGYEVTLAYVTTGNVEVNVARVEGRVQQGGHTVPPNKIRGRYERALSLLPRAVEEADRAFVFDSSGEEPMRLCFLKGRWEVPLTPPPYIHTRLVERLRGRRVERDDINVRFGQIGLPDENASEFTGRLIMVGTHYAVQKTDAGQFMRHDRLLLPDALVSNQGVQICYLEGAGSATRI